MVGKGGKVGKLGVYFEFGVLCGVLVVDCDVVLFGLGGLVWCWWGGC